MCLEVPKVEPVWLANEFFSIEAQSWKLPTSCLVEHQLLRREALCSCHSTISQLLTMQDERQLQEAVGTGESSSGQKCNLQFLCYILKICVRPCPIVVQER